MKNELIAQMPIVCGSAFKFVFIFGQCIGDVHSAQRTTRCSDKVINFIVVYFGCRFDPNHYCYSVCGRCSGR